MEHSNTLPLRALLLDRDGTINRDVGGSPAPEQIELLPGVAEALKRFSAKSVELFILTNHSFIGRGEDTMENHQACMERVMKLLQVEGIFIRGARTCPHTPEADCDCRKPKTGMWKSLKLQFPELDARSSLMVGDRDSDVLLGRAIGARTARIASGQYPMTDVPDYTVANLLELSELLL